MVFYFVQQGETLFSIARRYQTTVHAIVAANRLEDPNAICPGQALLIPRPGEVPSPAPGGIVHLVRPGETLMVLSERFGSSVKAILLANQIAHPEFVLPGQQLVIPEADGLGEDWPMVGRTPGRVGVSPVLLQGQPSLAWDHVPRHFLGLKPSAPVTRYSRVYAGLGDGFFYALDEQTGSLKWRCFACEGKGTAQTDYGGFTLAAPVIYDGLAYLCGPDGWIQAVHAHSGEPVWHLRLPGPISSAPLANDGILFVAGMNGQAYGLEAKTGALVWQTELDGPITHPAALGDDTLFVVTEEGSLWALEELTGEPCWQVPVKADQPPVFAELVVVVGGEAFEPASGELVWERPEQGCSPVARVDQLFYPGVVVDLFTGMDELSTGALPAEAHLLTGGHHLILTLDHRLVALDPASLTECWTLPLDAPGCSGLVVSAGLIFLTLVDGSLIAYRMDLEP